MFQAMIAIKQTRYQRLIKEGFWIFAGQLTAVVGSLALVKVLTSYLSPDQYGQLALGLTVAGLVSQVVMGGITAGIGRFYSIAAENHDLTGYFLASCRIMGYATIAVIVIGIILGAGLIILGYFQWLSLEVAIIVFSVLSGYNTSLSSIQNAARQRSIVAIHIGLEAWLKILLVMSLVLWLGKSSTVVAIGFACSALLVTTSQFFFLTRTIPKIKIKIKKEQYQKWFSQIWDYSLPFTTWGGFTWLLQVSDRWALQAFGTTSDVGQYAVLFQLGFTPITLITGMVISFMAPILYKRSGDANDHTRNANVHQIAWQMTYLSLIATLIGFAITFFLHEWLFYLFVASKYWAISYLLPWVVLAGGVFAAGQMMALKLMSEMKPSAMQTAKIFSALIGTILNIVGAAIAGIQGVVVALLVFSSIYIVWMAMLAKRVPRKVSEN